MENLKILFVGETWNGSSARSLRDALFAIDGVALDDIGEDQYCPKGSSLLIRTVNRLLHPVYRRELATEILRRCDNLKPNVVLVYKGNLVDSRTIGLVKARRVKVINIFPDYSPQAYTFSLRKSMGEYDLVISTKPYHPDHWSSTYGYSNRCVCVPHGYDMDVHYWADPPSLQDIDVVIAASWRPQYQVLMEEVGKLLPDPDVSVALAGPGWSDYRDNFPEHWQFPGPRHGLAYGEFLRRGKIVIAPVNTEVVINGKPQPGDQDTTRTYELASAGTFFLHRRTPYATNLYLEGKECGFWSDSKELVDKIRYYLPRELERRVIALAAHRRAVPAYSLGSRAQEILTHVQTTIRCT